MRGRGMRRERSNTAMESSTHHGYVDSFGSFGFEQCRANGRGCNRLHPSRLALHLEARLYVIAAQAKTTGSARTPRRPAARRDIAP